jgi:hypothetical protein
MTPMFFTRIRRRFTYANVAMTLVLVFALSGGAYAASRYVITSTKQIKPSVLKSLQGKAGINGAPGTAGPAGAQGPAGSQGPAGPAGNQGTAGAKGETGSQGLKGATGNSGATGPKGATGATGTTGFTETLPAGKTETGAWSVRGTAAAAEEPRSAMISFPIPLPSELNAPPDGHIEFVEAGQSTPEHCKGNVKEPGAEPGYLCVFEGKTFLHAGGLTFFMFVLPGAESEGAGKTGTLILFLTAGAAKEVSAEGTWAVTAPSEP